jgi:uncharacterized protein (TIGR02466 family)
MASSFESGTVAQLFATPIWSFRPVGAVALAARLAARLHALRAADPRWAPAMGRVWQSQDDLREDAEMQPLVALIHEASLAALKILEMDCRLSLTGLWGNVGSRTHFLHEHTHPNNFLSGVFYVAVPEDSGVTWFKDPRPQTRILRPRVIRENPLNSPEFQYRGAVGTLLMFPAWLEHGVTPNTTDEDRITLAFNLMVTGPLGDPALLAYSDV